MSNSNGYPFPTSNWTQFVVQMVTDRPTRIHSPPHFPTRNLQHPLLSTFDHLFLHRLQTLELENTSLREEAARCRAQAERLRAEKSAVTEQLGEAESVVSSLQDEVAALRDQERRQKECAHANQQLVEELTLEVDRLRREVQTLQELNQNSQEPQTQLQAQLDSLRQEHRNLLLDMSSELTKFRHDCTDKFTAIFGLSILSLSKIQKIPTSCTFNE
ncbi:hypothetical protein J6590_015269 [Homalodisca vitripennis]|nr:hypothetical protein J6590_015269 [Homalodisca vitripennis]